MPGACTTRRSGCAGGDVTASNPGTRPTGTRTPSGATNACVEGPTQITSEPAVTSPSSATSASTRPPRARSERTGARARRRRPEERSNQAGRVEPGLSGVESDLAHVIADDQRRLQRPGALTTDPLRGVATTREPLDTSAKLPLLLVALGPFERPARVMAGVAPELARQLAVRGHPVRVQPMVDLRLLPGGVQPCEGGAARALARSSRVEGHDARARSRRCVRDRGADDPEADDGEVVLRRHAVDCIRRRRSVTA